MRAAKQKQHGAEASRAAEAELKGRRRIPQLGPRLGIDQERTRACTLDTVIAFAGDHLEPNRSSRSIDLCVWRSALLKNIPSWFFSASRLRLITIRISTDR